jgi:hypothetical protein
MTFAIICNYCSRRISVVLKRERIKCVMFLGPFLIQFFCGDAQFWGKVVTLCHWNKPKRILKCQNLSTMRIWCGQACVFFSVIQKISLIFFVLLFICAYKAWFISSPCLHHSLTTHSTASIPSRNYLALISNFVVERV